MGQFVTEFQRLAFASSAVYGQSESALTGSALYALADSIGVNTNSRSYPLAACPRDSINKWCIVRGLDSDGYLSVVNCDLAAIKANPALLNDYVDNLARLSAAIQYNYDGIELRLETLQVSLAVELNLAQ